MSTFTSPLDWLCYCHTVKYHDQKITSKTILQYAVSFVRLLVQMLESVCISYQDSRIIYSFHRNSREVLSYVKYVNIKQHLVNYF